MAQAISGTFVFIAVFFEFGAIKNAIKKLDVITRKNMIDWLRVSGFFFDMSGIK